MLVYQSIIEYGSNPEHIVGQPSPNISHAFLNDR
jgi:hypothetical protein